MLQFGNAGKVQNIHQKIQKIEEAHCLPHVTMERIDFKVSTTLMKAHNLVLLGKCPRCRKWVGWWIFNASTEDDLRRMLAGMQAGRAQAPRLSIECCGSMVLTETIVHVIDGEVMYENAVVADPLTTAASFARA